MIAKLLQRQFDVFFDRSFICDAQLGMPPSWTAVLASVKSPTG
ncbi:hypothetical protein MIZ03_1466 [Rhodoferax lithotrophicus]|uniref:Uncharacterized protein n=1 Tax=Rhodoferax lithotrophicus TaxID=2798804 RepID=A0ABM7MK79_9BURK|nr:hypothetical protein MIZ03_1466 [Rhodoferax sp. MIZ03]